jgi:hypothetical protein
MCRNIRTLHHFDPPATPEEIEASALQYVRKVSGMRIPSRANEPRFALAVERIAAVTRELLGGLEAHGPPRDRDEERRKAAVRGRQREERLRSRLPPAPG